MVIRAFNINWQDSPRNGMALSSAKVETEAGKDEFLADARQNGLHDVSAIYEPAPLAPMLGKNGWRLAADFNTIWDNRENKNQRMLRGRRS